MLWVLNCQYVKTLMGEKIYCISPCSQSCQEHIFDTFPPSPDTRARGLQAGWCPPETQGERGILGSVPGQVANIRGNLRRHQGDTDSIPSKTHPSNKTHKQTH